MYLILLLYYHFRFSIHQNYFSRNIENARKGHSTKIKNQMVERDAWWWKMFGKL